MTGPRRARLGSGRSTRGRAGGASRPLREPRPAREASPGTADALGDDVEARYELVRRRYGARLSPAQLDDLRQVVGAIAEASRALRAVRLSNGDAPLPPLLPFRGAE